MRAVVRDFHSPDIDLETYQPDDPSDVGFLLQLLVGPSDGPGEESFDLIVCTPTWLQQRLQKQRAIFGAHHLIIARYDETFVKSVLTEEIAKCEAPTWPELTSRLARIGHWEFADYAE